VLRRHGARHALQEARRAAYAVVRPQPRIAPSGAEGFVTQPSVIDQILTKRRTRATLAVPPAAASGSRAHAT